MTQRLLGGTAAAVDRAATLLVRASSERRRRTAPLDHRERVHKLEQMVAAYPASLGDAFFRAPRRIVPSERQAAEHAGASAIDLSWPSDYEPFLPSVRERYLKATQNQLAHARLFSSREPRPIAVLIHGYMGGRYGVEQRLWNVPRFLGLGLDVALFVLPFHALRGSAGRRGAPEFPGNPRVSNEGFRQAMGDLLDLIGWLRTRGHREVGLMGMSLGGYSAALAATLDADLSFLVPVIPLASMADFAAEQQRLSEAAEAAALEHALLEQLHAVVSPLARQPRIARERCLVVGAKADRITPVRHARRLATHLGAPLLAWHGGHLLQFGRDACFKRIEALVADLGLLRR